MSEAEFDWSPLGEAFWQEAAATTGATELQARFACCRHRGMTASGAAREAGYASGEDDSGIRQAGSRAAKSTAVLNLLAMATAEAGGGEDGVVGTAEARRILSRLARGSDPNVRIKALESLNKLDLSAASVVDPTTPEQVFHLLVGPHDGEPARHLLLGPEHTLLRVVAAWALLGRPMYAKEFGPHIARAFPDVARALRPALFLTDGPLIPLEQLIGTVAGEAAKAQADEIAYHDQYGGHAREDGLARFAMDHVVPNVGGASAEH